MTAGPFPMATNFDPLSASLRAAVAAIEVVGPDEHGLVILRLTATWGEALDVELGQAGRDALADGWLAWRDLLA